MDFTGKRVTVMGLGRFGGGVGVTRYLCSRGARVLVTDIEPEDKLAQSVAKLRDLVDAGPPGKVTLRLGGHDEADFAGADLVVVNPAVDPRNNRYLQAAQRAGVPLTGEIRLLIAALPSGGRRRTIGVTGSAGKSTTTAMIGHILQKAAKQQSGKAGNRADTSEAHSISTADSLRESGAFRVHIGGNLGGSLLDRVDDITADDWVVLELSSFMLEGMASGGGGDQWSPHIAVVTSLSPNHVDRHGSFEGVIEAKQQILEHQALDDLCVLGPGVGGKMRPMCPQVFLDDDLPITLAIPGEHNLTNARLAIAATAACGLSGLTPRVAADMLRDFPGLPHRLQLVCEHQGVRYFNDSKSTTPEAAILAIRSFPPGVVHAILGGYDKGSDLTQLARIAAERCRAVYTIGKTGDAIAEACRLQSASPDDEALGSTHGPHTGFHACGSVNWNASHDVDIVPCGTLDRALNEIAPRLRRGDVVLLSPGCASWDQFDHFEQRGEQFVANVLRLTGETGLTPMSPP